VAVAADFEQIERPPNSAALKLGPRRIRPPPVAGGANGNSAVPGPAYPTMPGFGYSGYYLEAPGYSAQPGFIEEPGTTATPRRAAAAHHRSMYMYAPVQGGGAPRTR
jgi:hypothetical protein